MFSTSELGSLPDQDSKGHTVFVHVLAKEEKSKHIKAFQ